jgi:hypothetical protein
MFNTLTDEPNPVIKFAKKTGDYSVLSHADLCVLALTYALDASEKEKLEKERAERNEEVSTFVQAVLKAEDTEYLLLVSQDPCLVMHRRRLKTMCKTSRYRLKRLLTS